MGSGQKLGGKSSGGGYIGRLTRGRGCWGIDVRDLDITSSGIHYLAPSLDKREIKAQVFTQLSQSHETTSH